MLCGSCGYDNLDDARYCAICGSELTEAPGEPRADAGTIPCPSCDFLNEEIAVYCRSCGKKMKKRARRKIAKKPAQSEPPPEVAEESPLPLEPSVQEAELAVLFGLDTDTGEAEPATEPPAEPESAPPPDDERLVTNPEEMARLAALIESEPPAQAEEIAAEPPPDIEAAEPDEVAEEITEPEPEPEAEAPAEADAFSTYVSTPHESVEAVLTDEPEGDAEEEASEDGGDVAAASSIASMAEVTANLNSLIKDILDVEIEEGERADIVDAPSSVFPPPDPSQYAEPASEPAKVLRLPSLPKLHVGAHLRDAVGYFVLVASFLLSGLSIGLWVWYLFVS